MYQVKEVFYTLQGEGQHAGRAAVFCRFSGCNLWSGREEDRKTSPCYFCDTDFRGTDGPGGGKFKAAKELAEAILSAWRDPAARQKFVVFTGGEPLLQLDSALIAEVKARGFEIAVETNGTIVPPEGIDWLTVSPKPDSELKIRKGSELKLVFPQKVRPESLAELDFKHFYLSPLWSENSEELLANVEQATEYCREHPQWKLNLQRHKFWGIP